MTTHPINFINSDVEITGTVSFNGELTCHGTIAGPISSPGRLIIAKSGHIVGDIEVGSISVLGEIEGSVMASESCELHPGSALVGDLTAPSVKMAEGATFIGRSEVGTPPNSLVK